MTEATSEIGVLNLSGRIAGRRLRVLLSLALVVLAAASSLFMLRMVDGQLSYVDKSEDVRREAQALILALVDAETGQRGYLLTLDPTYLAPYSNATATINSTYMELSELVAGSAGQSATVGSLGPMIARKTEEMARTIALAAAGRLEQALAIMRSDEGERLITSLRQTIRGLIASEDATLVQHNADVQAYRQGLVIAILVALGGAVLLAYSLFARTQRQYSTLERARTELLSENERLEQHVRERTAEAEEARAHAERERARVEALLQDTNHRIGNSLATVSSLLGLQLTRSQSAEVRQALEAAQARVQAVASSHRRLRLGADLETIRVDEFLDMVLEDLRVTHASGSPVSFSGRFERLVIAARDATTVGIILGELVTNALKHAFPDGRSGTITVAFERNGAGVSVLIVEDDGKGLAGAASPEEGGLGATIVRQLARQFGGAPDYGARPGGGMLVTVTLPELELAESD